MKMKTKLIQVVPASLALLAIGFGEFSRWCSADGYICDQTTLDQMIPYMTYPLYFFALYALPIAIILIFVSRAIFNSWLKLAAWMLPLAFIFVATQPVVASFLSTDRDDAARLAAIIFTILSLTFIVWKWFAARRA